MLHQEYSLISLNETLTQLDGHSLLKIKFGLPAPHDPLNGQKLTWKVTIFSLIQPLTDLVCEHENGSSHTSNR